MTHRTTHSTAHLKSKDEPRSFFGSPKKLAKAGDKSTSFDPSPRLPSSLSNFIPSRSESSTPSPFLPSTTSQRTRSRGSKQVSPQVVTSILNGMLAHPVPVQETRPFTPRAWETEQPSHRLNALFEPPRKSISEVSRTSSDAKSQRTASSINSGLPSHSPTNSTTFPSHSSPSASVNSMAVARRNGSKSPSTSSQDSGSSGSTLRVMGRGGSGSRLRLVALQPEELAPRPKIRDVSLVPLQEFPDVKPVVPDKPVFIPPTGRGGLGSRPKPLATPPTFLTILNKGGAKFPKRKGKERAEPRNVHPIPPQLSYHITNNSSSTVNSSIHFAGESGPPSAPFFPSDPPTRRMRTVKSAEEISLSPAFSASSSTFSSNPPPSTPTTTIPDNIPYNVDLDFDVSDDEMNPSIPINHRQRSLSKLARTFGDVPPENLFDTHRSDLLHQNEHPPAMPTNGPFSKTSRSTKIARRSSLSITSLSSMFVRPSGRPRDSVATQHTMSTLTDDLHQLGLEDELDLNESSSDICHSPGSPIMFSPPSPNPVPNSSAERLTPHPGDTLDVGQENGGDSVPSPTLSRSLSYTPASRRRSLRIASHNHSASASLLTDIRFDSNGPALSNWIIPPPIDDDEIAFSITHNVPDKPQTWTGEWNSDIQDVIKSLRSLR
ncbi:hypothetical protein GALMADRAFT_902230 [Galerina marginata CBS 339.88]|uniref:Uncharacterized protein n=1 Tax=Galerina marginata (strain CBS 339.88) TaxID=685588 RepID=A0A067SJ52_GALM3|nr:hypothetical protein GALMADRAFT_902230 [Galerina marginata CBS 339.88]